ncbi:MAG: cytochrome P450 [Solirubrobacteraceae bacterium]|nr:cytochrome P450 [Solirubrobacteraceae bacterium]
MASLLTKPLALAGAAIDRVPVVDAANALFDRLPERAAQPLATPPPGSGLEPVMGDPSVPYIGRTLGFLRHTLEHCGELYDRFGSISWTTAFGTKMVLVLGPEAIGTVLANRDKAFSNKQGWDYLIGPFFDRGVMLMDGDEHLQHRRIMQEAFKRPRLVDYIAQANDTIARGVASWPNQEGFKLFDATKQLTLDIATEVFMGESLGPEADRLNHAFDDCVVGGQALIRHDVPGGMWHRGLRSRRLLADHFRSQIPAKRAGDGNDLFSVLCRAETADGERFTDEDVVNHMIFTMMAAHDTSTLTLSMMAYYLARHPEWQERLREEAVALGVDQIDYANVDRLPLMDLCFRETLRMNAPVGILGRRSVKDTELDGRFIPADTQLLIGIYPSQRMEPWWSDPHTFDPERFLPERAEDRSHKFAWAPFGAGAHKCIGMFFGTMEVKAILFRLLLTRRFSIPDGYEPPISYGTGPLPADGLPITLSAL